MTPSLRKKFVASLWDPWAVKQALEILQSLLVLLRKFGKQLSQQPVSAFMQEHYPEEYALYQLLWGIRLGIKDCLTLQQNLYEQLGEDALVALTTDDVLLGKELGQKDLVIVDGGDESSPALMIKSPFKVYKRSLNDDLHKIFHS